MSKARVVIAAVVVCLAGSQAMAGLLTNGNFETGDLSGWTTFTTTSGTIGAECGLPDIVMFDTNHDTTATNSARFQVGYVSTAGVWAGGGIYQLVNLAGGTYKLSADIAARDPNDVGNYEFGRFDLMVDGLIVDTHTFGAGDGFETKWSSLSANLTLDAGMHEIRILMQRDYGMSCPATPQQFVDNVALVPEPATMSLFALGGLALMRRRWRK